MRGFLVLLLLLTATAACSSIRVVEKTTSGGVVALRGSEGSAREKADEYMRSQCNGDYVVIDEANAEHRDRSEHQLTFRCKGAPRESAKTISFHAPL